MILGLHLQPQARTSQPPPAYRADVNLVTIPVTIADSKTARATRFTKDDFTLTVDGRRQAIEQFTSESVPLSVAIALDTSSSMMGERFQFARQAVFQLLESVTERDQLGVYGFDDQPYDISPWTTSHEAIASALNMVVSAKAPSSTALYEAVEMALTNLAVAPGPRRALVVISDGNDELKGDRRVFRPDLAMPINLSARSRLQHALERMQRSDALVYAIGIDSTAVALGSGRNRLRMQMPVDESGLRALTDRTGGFTTVVNANSQIRAAVQRIIEALRDQYVIGFVTTHPVDGSFHRVRVTVRGCACRVLARAGFWASRPEAP